MKIINIRTRLFPNGKLWKQIAYTKSMLKEFPESQYARFLLNSLRKKYWLGNKNVTYSSLLNYAWNKFIKDQTTDIIEIEGLKFVRDDMLKIEYTDIFLSYIYEQYPCFTRYNSIETMGLSMLNNEGSYENKDVTILKNDIVIDAGANMGVFSLFAKTKGAEKVYAFEPQEEAIRILKQNLELNKYKKEIEIIPLGLSDRAKQSELIRYKNTHATASIIKKHKGINDTQQIECVDLDSWFSKKKLSRINFIKADIEGAEREMLLGAKNILKQFSPRLAICTYHLQDDPVVLEKIILNANPRYTINHTSHKLFAYVKS